VVTKAPRPPPHPFLYFVLFLPFGATAGYVMVTIGYLASKAHIPDGTVAALVAMNTLPHTWKFLWAPAVDALWTGRRWYVSTNLVSSAAIIALGFIPITSGNVGILEVVIFVNGLATTFIGMCTEWLMAHLTPPEQRGRAAGWSQAGNLGGATVGGLGLLIAQRLVALHDGRLWATSEPDRGCVFAFALPYSTEGEEGRKDEDTVGG